MILELTPETAAELYAVRELLEGMAARLAVERIEDGALAEMARCLKEQKKVIEEKDLIGYSRLDFDFHGFISSSCSNKVLQEMLQNIKNKSRPITMLITPILPRLYHDHVEIYKALKQRDGEKAERAVRNHCRNMLKKIKEDTKTGNWVKKNFPFGPWKRHDRSSGRGPPGHPRAGGPGPMKRGIQVIQTDTKGDGYEKGCRIGMRSGRNRSLHRPLSRVGCRGTGQD